MGIREFSSIVQYGSIVEKLKYTEHSHNTPCEFDAIIIDTVSYFYACLVDLKLEPGEDLDFTVYRDLARQCFDRIIQTMYGESFFKCKEVFISFDILAPATKRRTQNERRIRGCYVEMSERMKFYKALVMEFVDNINSHCTHEIVVSFPISFEGYESAIAYKMGEGEYIGVNYIYHLYSNKSYKSFVMFGNDNDILMMSCIFNTCLEGMTMHYISLSRGLDGPVRKHLECNNVVDAFVFMCNTFLVGNDFIPLVVSGTNNQIKNMFDDSLYTSDCAIKLASRAFDMRNNETVYESSYEVIEDLANFINKLLISATSTPRAKSRNDESVYGKAATVEIDDYDYHNLDIFVKRFVWNVCYYANTLYSPAGHMMYSEFSNIFPVQSMITVNSPVFIDDVKDRVLRFLIETSIKNGTLVDKIRKSLKMVFTPCHDYILDCNYLLRASKCSAGVDFIIRESIPPISPGCDFILPLKCIPYCLLENFYVIERSSSFVRGVECALIDDDGGRNTTNVKIVNKSNADVVINIDSRIFQIIFTPYSQNVRGLRANSSIMRGDVGLEYHDGHHSFNYTGADVTNTTDAPLIHTVDTHCYITLINVKFPHVYVKICAERLSGVNIHNGIIDSDYTDSVKLLCIIEPGCKLGTNTKLCEFRMFEYINVQCNIKNETRMGGIGSSD